MATLLATGISRGLQQALADLLFPRVCVGCGQAPEATARYFCWDCLAHLAWIKPPFCHCCGDPIAGSSAHAFHCASCQADRPHFDLARAAARYRGVMQSALQEFKYHRATWLSHDLGQLLLAAWRVYYMPLALDTLCYIPLHSTKERERSYNQAELLARELHKTSHIRLQQLLIKTRPTPTQTHLTARARRANIKSSFAVTKKGAAAGRRVLLIDDVMTTGATVNECARTLKQAGAEAVYVLTVARG